MIRFLDILFSTLGLIILLPIFFLILCWIKLDSKGTVLYKQERIGLYGKPFYLLKFRTMRANADKLGLLTVGQKDVRITRAGFFLRKYKLDELPQLFNVLKGEMSLVGPRPEVKKYVDMYSLEQKRVLSVKPGITDYASIYYKNENEILALASDPEQEYITRIMPHKVMMNLKYIESRSMKSYFIVIFKTLSLIIK